MKDKEYMRQYMRDYRQGRKRQLEKAKVRELMVADRLKGDDIYTIGLRYGYNPVYVCRLFKDLPVKKHTNRHKLYWSNTSH